jgi:tRNA A37 threonylcarbamoyladenosine dehydratase
VCQEKQQKVRCFALKKQQKELRNRFYGMDERIVCVFSVTKLSFYQYTKKNELLFGNKKELCIFALAS